MVFHTKENKNYIRPIPVKNIMYFYNLIKPESRKKFLEFNLQKIKENYIFYTKKGIVEYC